jgi:hypothetical protein
MSTSACPQCSGIVDPDSRFCKHCAFDLSKPAPDADATIVTTSSQQPTNSKRSLLIVGAAVIGLLILGTIGGYLYIDTTKGRLGLLLRMAARG